jgi:hypothetical protein
VMHNLASEALAGLLPRHICRPQTGKGGKGVCDKEELDAICAFHNRPQASLNWGMLALSSTQKHSLSV